MHGTFACPAQPEEIVGPLTTASPLDHHLPFDASRETNQRDFFGVSTAEQ
jgi:hypothetical protein